MKQKLSYFKQPKVILTALLTLLVTVALMGLSAYEKSLIPSFSQFCEQMYTNELCCDGLSIHFLVKNTDSLDFPVCTSLPVYTGIRSRKTCDELEEVLNLYSKIEVTENAVYELDYAICEHSLKTSLELSRYPYLEEPLSPNGGLHTEILLLLCAYPFYEMSDVTQYLSLLRSFDSFTNSLISYEYEKKAQGLFMSYSASKLIIDQCDAFSKSMEWSPCASMSEIYELLDDPEREISFLAESFLTRLLSFYESGQLTETEFLNLTNEHGEILKNTVAPSYERLADTIWLLQDTSIPVSGLCSLPNGKEYYEALLSAQTGSDKTVSEMKELLMNDLSTQYKLLQDAVSSYYLEQNDSSFTPDFPVTQINDQLTALQSMIASDFPKLSEYSSSPVQCQVLSVPQGLTDYTAPAFYIQTPMDALQQQAIYINYEETNNPLSLFTTLAHEGYPGHLYQHVISTQKAVEENRSPLRFLLSYPGYQEGWAVYVEFYAYAHAKDYCSDPVQGQLFDLIALDRRVCLCLYALSDVMIHDEGADYNTIHHFLSDYGITSPSSTKAIYEYIAESPCNYMKYYMGYLEVLECKRLAESCWQNHYSDLNFHRFMLEFGPAPFNIIKEEIKTSSF